MLGSELLFHQIVNYNNYNSFSWCLSSIKILFTSNETRTWNHIEKCLPKQPSTVINYNEQCIPSEFNFLVMEYWWKRSAKDWTHQLFVIKTTKWLFNDFSNLVCDSQSVHDWSLNSTTSPNHWKSIQPHSTYDKLDFWPKSPPRPLPHTHPITFTFTGTRYANKFPRSDCRRVQRSNCRLFISHLTLCSKFIFPPRRTNLFSKCLHACSTIVS